MNLSALFKFHFSWIGYVKTPAKTPATLTPNNVNANHLKFVLKNLSVKIEIRNITNSVMRKNIKALIIQNVLLNATKNNRKKIGINKYIFFCLIFNFTYSSFLYYRQRLV